MAASVTAVLVMWQHQQRCYHTVQQQQLLPCSVTATAVATQCDGKNWSLQKNRKNDSNQPAVHVKLGRITVAGASVRNRKVVASTTAVFV